MCRTKSAEVVPIVFVLINGMLLFTLATVSWQNPQRHMVLVVTGAGAIAICVSGPLKIVPGNVPRF